MYFFGRGISAFFNQLFKWLFWNKTGQKLLFCIVIVFIFFCFIKLGEVAAVEEVSDVNYNVYSYYENITNEAISFLGRLYINQPDNGLFNDIKNNNYDMQFYFYYGNSDGSSYANAVPINKTFLNIIEYGGNLGFTRTPTTNDYLAITGKTLYNFTGQNVRYRKFNVPTGTVESVVINSFYMPLDLYNYKTSNWLEFEDYIRNNSTQQIIELLDSINESLTNTEPTSDTDDMVQVDSSAVDDVSSASVDNVFSTMTTGFANKFTNYDLSTVNSFVWNLNGTRITFYSDTLYKMIRGTFFETLLSMLWYYIFGHYAFVWLSNIIHKIKDGSILDGLEVNEVITKEML